MKKGFTIAELIVVVTVIGILATIGYIAWGNWKQNIAINEAKSGLNQLSASMDDSRNFGGVYPSTIPTSFDAVGGRTTFTQGQTTFSLYTAGGGATYCGVAQSTAVGAVKYYLYVNPPTTTGPQSANPGGDCAGH